MEGFELVDIFTTASRLGRTTVICIFLVFHFDKCKEYFLISKYMNKKKRLPPLSLFFSEVYSNWNSM